MTQKGHGVSPKPNRKGAVNKSSIPKQDYAGYRCIKHW